MLLICRAICVRSSAASASAHQRTVGCQRGASPRWLVGVGLTGASLVRLVSHPSEQVSQDHPDSSASGSRRDYTRPRSETGYVGLSSLPESGRSAVRPCPDHKPRGPDLGTRVLASLSGLLLADRCVPFGRVVDRPRLHAGCMAARTITFARPWQEEACRPSSLP